MRNFIDKHKVIISICSTAIICTAIFSIILYNLQNTQKANTTYIPQKSKTSSIVTKKALSASSNSSQKENPSGTVQLLDKSVTAKDTDKGIYSDIIRLTYSYTNNTQKDIKGFEGNCTFNDMFGNKIETVGLEVTQNIPAKSTVNDNNKGIEVNQFKDDDEKLKDTDYKNLKMIFTITKVIFTDGSEVTK
jgi:hypothetical protein